MEELWTLSGKEDKGLQKVDVDGYGARRVLSELRGEHFWLRPALAQDCQVLWRWANEKSVRHASFSSDAISWEEHTQWFAGKQKEKGCRIYIAVSETDQPVGQIRFDRVNRKVRVSVIIDPASRGSKMAADLIRSGTEHFQAKEPTGQDIHAWIKPSNFPSLKAFSQAGYQKQGEATINGMAAAHYLMHA